MILPAQLCRWNGRDVSDDIGKNGLIGYRLYGYYYVVGITDF